MKKLTDIETHDRLLAAREALGDDLAETVRSDTALKAARQALSGLALSLLFAMERDEDRIEGVKGQGASSPPQP